MDAAPEPIRRRGGNDAMTDRSLSGKTAIVTGAGNGIGRAVALVLAKAGAAVICVDIEEAAAKQTADVVVNDGGRALGIGCDVS